MIDGSRATVKEQPERARLEQELAQARSELEATRSQLLEASKMAELGRLLAGIIHEINTPLGSIRSNNQVAVQLLDKLNKALSEPSPVKALEIVETLENLASVDEIACERIRGIIRGVKVSARVDDAELDKVDLHENIRNCLKLTAFEFRRRVSVETDFGELPNVECYPHMMDQVFLNVLINASQAIEGEGKVIVRTRLEGDCAHISISDSGHGIKPEDRGTIFSSGFTTKPVGIGSGLGLSISKQILEKHGGSIEFESEVGVGTTFHIRIPVAQARKGAG